MTQITTKQGMGTSMSIHPYSEVRTYKEIAKTEVAQKSDGSKLNESQRATFVNTAIKFTKDQESGKLVAQWKDKNGTEHQVPAEEAIRTSERIKKYLEKVGTDLTESTYKHIDIHV